MKITSRKSASMFLVEQRQLDSEDSCRPLPALPVRNLPSAHPKVLSNPLKRHTQCLQFLYYAPPVFGLVVHPSSPTPLRPMRAYRSTIRRACSARSSRRLQRNLPFRYFIHTILH